jgi:hypothetical protein
MGLQDEAVTFPDNLDLEKVAETLRAHGATPAEIEYLHPRNHGPARAMVGAPSVPCSNPLWARSHPVLSFGAGECSSLADVAAFGGLPCRASCGVGNRSGPRA